MSKRFITRTFSRPFLSIAIIGTLSSWQAISFAAEETLSLGEMTVTGTREEQLRAETSETTGVIARETIEEVRPAHPSELMNRIPGVHVNVTGGEGHMTAIRQPITTKPVYLYLEDGIPTRSTGFFNHNALYEINVPQAGGVEVTKGPGTALYGSDAIGGVINVLTRPAPLEAEGELNLEAGEYGWYRMLLTGGNSWNDNGVRGDLNLTHTDGWREKTAYDRQSATVRMDNFFNNGASLKTVLAMSNIDQETAGSSRLLKYDFENNPTKNYTPISYREVDAVRLSTEYEQEGSDSLFTVTPYARKNNMEYLANWSLSYDPGITETSSNSLGMLMKYRKDFAPKRTRLVVGADLDYTPGSRLENRINAVKEGLIYTSYTIEGMTYDYDVEYLAISPYLHFETSPTERLRLNAGLRYDLMEYDYANNMTDGVINVGGKNYDHASDTTVDFTHLSPKLGATYLFSDDLNGFVSYRNAFRAPSEGQLFRPGSNDADETLALKPVEADSYEVGIRGRAGKRFNYEASVYYMPKKDDLVTFEDPVTGDRYTVNAGKTLHQGIELGADAEFAKDWGLAVSYSYTKQTYEDWVEKGTDFSGNEIEFAPKDMANTRLNYHPLFMNGGRFELEWAHLGEYWMDAANTHKYDGYDLLNFRVNYPFDNGLELYGRLMNVTDERYATAAKYTPSGWGPEKFEYAPGMPRAVYAGFNYKF
ncbi:MAG: TonB-dependent receptor [Arenicellales bacterium]